MEKEFKNLLKSDFPYLCSSKLLIAVSGGVDSVVLVHLCKLAKLNFAMAHCNFDLRGEESDEDEKFVVDLADALEVEVFIQKFDTESFASEAGISIQMAARELRYDWFRQIVSAIKFDYILTAHHANDNLETFLINLVRGSGIEGFTGIKAENNNLVRPLLKFSRKEIEDFAAENGLRWREDSSNASSKYLRNKIRHQIIPVMEEINPQLLESFSKTQDHLRESYELIEDYISLLYSQIVSKNRYGYSLKIEVLERVQNPKTVLFHLLKTFGFKEWNDVVDLMKGQPGKMVVSETHRLIKDREYLLLTEIPSAKSLQSFDISEGEEVVMLPIGTFTLNEVNKIEKTSLQCVYVSKDKITFPLELRQWKEGDVFYPFGMKGKKKLSDFFQDKKLSLPEKENTWLLCCEGKIVWVVNHRADARFAITKPSEKILKITCSV